MTQQPLCFLPPEASSVSKQKPGGQLLSCRVSSPGTVAWGWFQDPTAPCAVGESNVRFCLEVKERDSMSQQNCRHRREKLLQLPSGTWWYILLLPRLSNSDWGQRNSDRRQSNSDRRQSNSDKRQSNSQDVFSLRLCTFIVYLLPPGACEAGSWSSTLCRRHRREAPSNWGGGSTTTQHKSSPQCFMLFDSKFGPAFTVDALRNRELINLCT